jgi:hypothetical protein
MIDIEINSACRQETRIVGDERTPVVVLDCPILSTEELVDYASRHADFDSGDEFVYPGIRADLPDQYARVLMPQLVGLIAHIYNIPRSFKPYLIHQLFSLVTHAPEDLQPLQRMPHSLEHAGTGFFRHRPTQFERITEDRYQPFKQAATSFMEANGLPAEKYINASDDHFKLIAEIEHQPNRMAIYPGNLLHSGLINPDRDIDDNPATGRLTANLFIYFAPM